MNGGENLLSGVARLYAELQAWLAALPEYVLLIVLLAPTLLAIATRSLLFVCLTALLNLAGLFVLSGAAFDVSLLLAVVTFAGALATALYGIVDRRRTLHLREIAGHVDHMDRQIVVFLKALDRRTELMDRRDADQYRQSTVPAAASPAAIAPADHADT